MSDNDVQGANQLGPQRKRLRFCACGLCALVIAAASTAWLYHTASDSRFRVVVATDPVTHCRLEYTVSSRYFPRSLPPAPPVPPDILGYADYIRKPSPKLIAWMEKYLIHRSKSTSSVYTTMAGHILVCGWQLNQNQLKAEDEMQSPDSNSDKPGSSQFTTMEFRHIVVSKSTAMWYVSEWGPHNQRFRSYTLIVHPLHVRISYMFNGFAEGADDQEKLRSEMIAIRDSIKIEWL